MNTSELVEYQSLLGELKRRLGLSCLMIYEKDGLMSYYLYILKYVVEILVTEDLENPESINRIIELYDQGQTQIIEGNVMSMIMDYVPLEDVDTVDPILWVDAWVELMKALYLAAAYNYAYLFAEEPKGCQCSCTNEEGDYVLPEKKPYGSEYVKCGCGK